MQEGMVMKVEMKKLKMDAELFNLIMLFFLS